MFDRLRRARASRGSARHLADAALDDGVDALAPRLPLARLRDELVACPECDALHDRAAGDAEADRAASCGDVAPIGRHYECRRCGAPLGLERHGGFELPLSLAMAGLVVFAIAQLNPVMAIDIQGQVRATTLWEAAWTLYDDGAWLLCGTVLFTTLVNPLVELAAVCYVLLPLRSGEPAPGAGLVLRAMRAVRPWVMIEVFMLGALVAFTKLSAMARVTPGVGLWSFGVLMLLVAASASTFDHEHAWAAIVAARREARAQREALRRHLADL
ncbi:MAG: paraquat-inducible protein A [Burkholderiaceae bacterium]